MENHKKHIETVIEKTLSKLNSLYHRDGYHAHTMNHSHRFTYIVASFKGEEIEIIAKNTDD